MTMLKVFTDDRNYTYEALVEQLNLVEIDFRDGFYKECASVPEKMLNQLYLIGLHYLDDSWMECKCNIEKHIPSILGLSKEGINQAKDSKNKEVFRAIRNDGLAYKRRLDEGQLTQEETEQFSKWISNAIDEVDKINKSWDVCVINTNDYVTRISGLAGEAIGFTNDETEKSFMKDMRDTARGYTHRINSSDISPKEAEQMRNWAREMRRRVTNHVWAGELPKTSRKDDESHLKKSEVKYEPAVEKKVSKVEDDENCPTCTLVPDKYKKKSGVKDWTIVTPIDSPKVTKKIEDDSGNQDIMWIQR